MTTAIKERPILFSSAMVRAILDGRKTQTRRIIKGAEVWPGVRGGNGGASWATPDGYPYPERGFIRCPFGSPGDRLWVREKFILVYCEADEGFNPSGDVPFYAADGDFIDEQIRWRPSIHMPRWASRITLEVIGIRVERLQDITEEDAIAEGAQCAGVPASLTNRGAFEKLWELIHGVGTWEQNPWVWVVEFRKAEDRIMCDLCGDPTDDDLSHCADCGKAFCDECGGWCGDPDDEPRGDYFCENCQENDQ